MTALNPLHCDSVGNDFFSDRIIAQLECFLASCKRKDPISCPVQTLSGKKYTVSGLPNEIWENSKYFAWQKKDPAAAHAFLDAVYNSDTIVHWGLREIAQFIDEIGNRNQKADMNNEMRTLAILQAMTRVLCRLEELMPTEKLLPSPKNTIAQRLLNTLTNILNAIGNSIGLKPGLKPVILPQKITLGQNRIEDFHNQMSQVDIELTEWPRGHTFFATHIVSNIDFFSGETQDLAAVPLRFYTRDPNTLNGFRNQEKSVGKSFHRGHVNEGDIIPIPRPLHIGQSLRPFVLTHLCIYNQKGSSIVDSARLEPCLRTDALGNIRLVISPDIYASLASESPIELRWSFCEPDKETETNWKTNLMKNGLSAEDIPKFSRPHSNLPSILQHIIECPNADRGNLITGWLCNIALRYDIKDAPVHVNDPQGWTLGDRILARGKASCEGGNVLGMMLEKYNMSSSDRLVLLAGFNFFTPFGSSHDCDERMPCGQFHASYLRITEQDIHFVDATPHSEDFHSMREKTTRNIQFINTIFHRRTREISTQEKSRNSFFDRTYCENELIRIRKKITEYESFNLASNSTFSLLKFPSSKSSKSNNFGLVWLNAIERRFRYSVPLSGLDLWNTPLSPFPVYNPKLSFSLLQTYYIYTNKILANMDSFIDDWRKKREYAANNIGCWDEALDISLEKKRFVLSKLTEVFSNTLGSRMTIALSDWMKSQEWMNLLFDPLGIFLEEWKIQSQKNDKLSNSTINSSHWKLWEERTNSRLSKIAEFCKDFSTRGPGTIPSHEFPALRFVPKTTQKTTTLMNSIVKPDEVLNALHNFIHTRK